MPHSQPEKPISPSVYALGFLGVTIFGLTLPVTAIALADFSPWFLTFSRALIAGLLAFAWLVITGRPLRHENNGLLFVAGLLLIFGFPGFMSMAMQSVPASHGGIVLGLAPIATAIIAVLIAGERQSNAFWLVAITGCAIVIAFVLWNASSEKGDISLDASTVGYGWMIIASLCASTGYVLSGKLSREMSGQEVICRALIVNLPLIVFGTVILWQWRFMESSITGLLALAYLGAFSMFLGFFFWNTALAKGGIGRIGQIQLLQIFITIFGSAVLLGETISMLTFSTAILVTVLVWFSRRL